MLVATALVATGVGLAARALFRSVSHPVTDCTIGTAPRALALTLDQAEDATTIAAVAKRLRLPDHAVTVALATALQESKLHNVPFGDRDSVGLFQQRPSQGWGTVADLMDPEHSAGLFLDRLAKVPGWESLSVTAAAQAVQRSAYPGAYQRHQPVAEQLAAALD